MQIGFSPSTGQYFGRKSDGSVVPLRVGVSESTGARFYEDEDGSVKPLPLFEEPKREEPKQEAQPAPAPQAEAPQAQAQPATAAQPAQPARDYDIQLENPAEDEDYEAPTEAEKSFIERGAQAMRSAVPSEALRQFGVGTRSVLQGLGSAADVFRLPMNYVNGLLGGDPEYFKNAGTYLSDTMNLPQAQGGTESVVQKGVEMAAGAVPYLLTGQALTQAANPVVQGVGSFLKMAPAEQILASGLAGMASEKAAQNGAGTGTQLAAGLLAGVAPGTLATAARVTGRTAGTLGRAADLFTEAGRDRAAGRTIARAAGGNTDDLLKATENAAEIVPGSKPTLGQLYNGENLATLEKGVASSGQGQSLQERYMSQKAARQAATDDAVGAASARLAAEREATATSLPAGMEADTAGGIIRRTYDDNLRTAKNAVSRAYQEIDPEQTAIFDLQALQDANASVIGGSRYDALPAEIRSIQGQIAEDVRNGVPATYADMQAMRRRLRELADSAHRTGDDTVERLATGMKKNVDDLLENAADGGFSPEQAQRFREAKRLRLEQQKDFAQGANKELSTGGSSLNGQRISDAAVAGNYFRKGNEGTDSMRAFWRMAKGDKKATEALKEYARGLLHSRAVGRNGMLDAAQIAKFRKDYAAALKEMPDLEKEISQLESFVRRQERQTEGLRTVARQNGDGWRMQRNVDLQGAAGGRFGPQGTGSFTQGELDTLAAVQQDANRAARAAEAANVKGSPTAQLFATQDLARRFWGDTATAAGNSWLGSLLSNAAQGVANKLFFSGTNDALNQRLVSAMLDPAYAAYLVRRAGSETQKQRENLLDLIARSAGGAANVSARTAAADRK